MSILSTLMIKIKKKRDIVSYYRSLGTKIGDNCEVYSSASFGSEPYLISIGNHVRINHGVQFVTHDGGVWVLRTLSDKYSDIDLFGQITVADNVHIGTNAIIMPGVHIGKNCIIGCGAIVTRDIPDNSIAVGIPARVMESTDTYMEKHIQELEHTKQMTAEEKKKYLCEKYSIYG